MSQFYNSYVPYSEPYTRHQDLASDEPTAVRIPQTDFDPYYSDIAAYDSEIDNQFLSIPDLGIVQGVPTDEDAMMVPFGPPMKLQQFPDDLSSEPPVMPEQLNQGQDFRAFSEFSEIPSSPPSSPERLASSRSVPPRLTHRQNLDSLGISHPFGHRLQSSITSPNSTALDSFVSDPNEPPEQNQQRNRQMENLQSPYMMAPMPKQAVSPNIRQHQLHQQHHLQAPPVHQQLCGSHNQHMMPNLSPALSDESLSPDLQSPEHGFSWQPVVTDSRSEDTEAINDQQRKPKQKRKSCLPEGVVDEYVGTTEVDGMYMCLVPHCQRLFKRTYNLRSHIQTHLRDRPYVCKTCSANFVRPHDLRRHERSHSTDRPFVCPCGKGFNRQDAMQRHRLREICSGAISSGVPKSPRPRGRPKGRKNTPNHSPALGSQPNTPSLNQSPHINSSPEVQVTPVFAPAPSLKLQ